MLHRSRIIPKNLIRCLPSQRPHREIVIVPVVIDHKLSGKVLKGVEGMGGIETLIVLPVAAFHFPVVPWSKGPDQFMPIAMLRQVCLEKGKLVPVGGEAIGEFCPVVRLDALDRKREGFHQVLQEQDGGLGAMFLKNLYEAPSGILVDGGILEEASAQSEISLIS